MQSNPYAAEPEIDIPPPRHRKPRRWPMILLALAWAISTWQMIVLMGRLGESTKYRIEAENESNFYRNMYIESQQSIRNAIGEDEFPIVEGETVVHIRIEPAE